MISCHHNLENYVRSLINEFMKGMGIHAGYRARLGNNPKPSRQRAERENKETKGWERGGSLRSTIKLRKRDGVTRLPALRVLQSG
jgi:hypothetical protein